MIKKIISETVLSLFMDKHAKEKFHAVQETRKARKRGAKGQAQAAESPVGKDATKNTPMSREDLIKNALAVHKEQSKVLDDLSINDRQKLELLAMQAMKGKGDRPT